MNLLQTMALLLLLLMTTICQAAEVRLKDGTVVYGTILSMQDGDDLVIDTSFMDAVTIEWDAVVSIKDTQVVEIELFDGQR
ncbi:hypothetical protein [Congregibacter sp.]|uniref:hypothetical protein n=1 Tax=Congregibacter sp. TaxID=2744308 RepID=UPI003F6CCDF7